MEDGIDRIGNELGQPEESGVDDLEQLRADGGVLRDQTPQDGDGWVVLPQFPEHFEGKGRDTGQKLDLSDDLRQLRVF